MQSAARRASVLKKKTRCLRRAGKPKNCCRGRQKWRPARRPATTNSKNQVSSPADFEGQKRLLFQNNFAKKGGCRAGKSAGCGGHVSNSTGQFGAAKTRSSFSSGTADASSGCWKQCAKSQSNKRVTAGSFWAAFHFQGFRVTKPKTHRESAILAHKIGCQRLDFVAKQHWRQRGRCEFRAHAKNHG